MELTIKSYVEINGEFIEVSSLSEDELEDWRDNCYDKIAEAMLENYDL